MKLAGAIVQIDEKKDNPLRALAHAVKKMNLAPMS